MKPFITMLACLAASGLLVWADDKATQELLDAAHRLAEEQSYAWYSTSVSAPGTHDRKQGPTHGKIAKNGFGYVTFELSDSKVEMVFHQDRSAIKWDDTWHGREELKDNLAWIADRLKTYKFAADEAAFLAAHTRDARAQDEGEITGALDDEALRYLLSRGRREVENVADIKGSIRFSLRDGRLHRYEYDIKGPVPYGGDGALVSLDRTTKVEIKDVGQTEVQVPEGAAEKVR